MSKVGIAELKAHLSKYLRSVRAGRTLMVLDRSTPIAWIVPFDAASPLEIRPATRKPSSLQLLLAPAAPTDSLSALLKDRASR